MLHRRDLVSKGVSVRRPITLSALIIAGLLATGLSAWQQPADPKVIEVDRLADNLYLLRGGGGNTAAFITADGVVLVDSKLSGWGQALLEAVRTFTDKPVTTPIMDTNNGGSGVEYPATLEKASALSGIDTVITGHPGTATIAELREYAAFIRHFVTTMQEAKAGRTLDEAAAAWTVPSRFVGYVTPNVPHVRLNAEVVWKDTP